MDDTGERLLSRDEVEERFGITRRFLEKQAITGGGPAMVKVGRSARYRVQDVRQWLAEQTVAAAERVVQASEARGEKVSETPEARRAAEIDVVFYFDDQPPMGSLHARSLRYATSDTITLNAPGEVTWSRPAPGGAKVWSAPVDCILRVYSDKKAYIRLDQDTGVVGAEHVIPPTTLIEFLVRRGDRVTFIMR